MTLEAVLAALHMVAILTLVVFLTSEAALCRSEWMNPAVVKRLARLDLIYGITAVVLLALVFPGTAILLNPGTPSRSGRWSR